MMKTKEDYLNAVRSFLGEGDWDISYEFQIKDELVFLCVDKNLDYNNPIGLPIFVLVNSRGPRFADAEETKTFMMK